MCVYVSICICLCVRAEPPEIYGQFAHKWVPHSTQRSQCCEQKPPPFLPHPLPCRLASQHCLQVSSPSFEPIPAFFPPPASSAAVGTQRPLPLHRAAQGKVQCSGAITKWCLHRRQQLLINCQRWNLWHKLLKLWFKSMVKSRSGRDRNLIHLSQLPPPGVAAWKEKGAHEPQPSFPDLCHFKTPARTRILGIAWNPPSLGAPKHQNTLTRIHIHFMTMENKNQFAGLRVSDWKRNSAQTPWAGPRADASEAEGDFWATCDVPMGSWG